MNDIVTNTALGLCVFLLFSRSTHKGNHRVTPDYRCHFFSFGFTAFLCTTLEEIFQCIFFIMCSVHFATIKKKVYVFSSGSLWRLKFICSSSNTGIQKKCPYRSHIRSTCMQQVSVSDSLHSALVHIDIVNETLFFLCVCFGRRQRSGEYVMHLHSCTVRLCRFLHLCTQCWLLIIAWND